MRMLISFCHCSTDVFVTHYLAATATAFSHDQQIIETAQKKVPLLLSLTIVAHLQRLVVADHADDVHRLQILPHDREQFKPQRHERLALHKRITHLKCLPGLSTR